MVAQHTNRKWCSSFSLANGSSSFVHGFQDISFPQTVPIQGQNSGAYWTGEGPQYLHLDPSTHTNAHHGFEAFPAAQESQNGPGNGRNSISGPTISQWEERLSSTTRESKNMSLPSQDTNILRSQRVARSSTGNLYDETSSSRRMPNAPVPFHMSSARSDVTARSISPEAPIISTPAPQTDLQGLEYPLLGNDAASIHPMFHRTSSAGMEPHQMDVSLSEPSLSTYTTIGEDSFSIPAGSNVVHGQEPVSTEESMYKSGTLDSSLLWDNSTLEFLDSQRSSPMVSEDPWAMDGLPIHSIMTSSTGTPLTYSPSLEGPSPRYVQDYPDLVELPPYSIDNRVTRKPMGPRQSKVASDLATHSRQQRQIGSEASEDFRLVGRSALEIDTTARDHPLYQNVSPGPDGLYHCPWEGQASCTHKPEKLKCNYEYDLAYFSPSPVSSSILTALCLLVNR